MNKEIDLDSKGNEHTHLEFDRNIKHIKRTLKTPIIYKTILFILLYGSLIPVFPDVNYFF